MSKNKEDFGTLKHVVTHKLSKKQGTKIVSKSLAEELISITDEGTLDFFENFMKMKSASTKDVRYTAFKERDESDVSTKVDTLLDTYLAKSIEDNDFYDLSLKIANLFASCLEATVPAVGGNLIIFDYEKNEHLNMAITLINEEKSTSLTDNLKFKTGKALNIKQIAFAAIIDCTNWKSECLLKERPNFISLVTGLRDIPDYYKNLFLGCERVVNGTAATSLVMKSFDDFCKSKGYNTEKIDHIREIVYNHCITHHTETHLKDLLNAAFPEEPLQDEYYEFCKNENYEVSASFKPNKTALNKWDKVAYNKNGINLKIDRAKFDDNTVTYKNKMLIIKDPTGEIGNAIREQK